MGSYKSFVIRLYHLAVLTRRVPDPITLIEIAAYLTAVKRNKYEMSAKEGFTLRAQS